MSEDAKYPTVLPAALADFADKLDAVGALDEAKKPARHLAIQAILGFFRSAGIDKEILRRLWQQQEEIEQLKKNLRRADAMKDLLQATLFMLAHIHTHFEPLGIKSTRLKGLENALSDVLVEGGATDRQATSRLSDAGSMVSGLCARSGAVHLAK